MRFVRLIAIVVCLFPSGFARTGASQNIPLDQIWGYNLPGTRDIAGIPFPEHPQGVGQTLAFLSREREYNIEQIRLALAMKPPGKTAAAGFVVPSKVDSRTLSGVLSTLRGKPNPFQQLAESEFSLVFFSHPLSYYTRLLKVERDGNQITVHYQFEPHTTPEVTTHFALIPLGKLATGKYQVVYKQTPIDQKYRDIGFEPVHPDAAEIVCRDFSFTVAGPKKEEPPLEGATMIPLDHVWGYELPGTRDIHAILSMDMREQLHRGLGKPRKAGPAFVVAGKDKQALENAIAILTMKAEPKRDFPEGDLNLVFYSYTTGGYYVRIDKIEQAKQKIVVSYHFESHHSEDASYHFALIPLQLTAGAYEVEIKQLSPEGNAPPRDMSGLVCGNTSFQVGGDP